MALRQDADLSRSFPFPVQEAIDRESEEGEGREWVEERGRQ